MQRINEIAVIFTHNGTFHDDLFLRLGDQCWCSDSYYLLIDHNLLPEEEDAAKVRVVLRHLLDQWISTVNALATGDVCYLPWDFSDQSTGWVKCEANGDDLQVQRGWAEVEGWSFLPSEVGKLLRKLPGFQPMDPIVVISRESFVKCLSSTIQ